MKISSIIKLIVIIISKVHGDLISYNRMINNLNSFHSVRNRVVYDQLSSLKSELEQKTQKERMRRMMKITSRQHWIFYLKIDFTAYLFNLYLQNRTFRLTSC